MHTLRSSYPASYLAVAIEIVVKAGDMQMQYLRTNFTVAKKSAIDLVTDVDLAIEAMCREIVAARFPDHVVFGEEMGTGGRAVASHCWIFDPIDGTTNYAHGMPIFCASLALEIDGRPEIGVVYDPNRRELFVAERGGGAFLNGEPLRVSGSRTLLDAMLVTGFPYDVHERVPEIVGLFGAYVQQARAVRRLGSAALDLCYVAAGRLDGFWEQDLKPWDVAAGGLLVEEAGGRVSDFEGGPFSSRHRQVLATNGHIHDEMLTVAGKFFRG